MRLGLHSQTSARSSMMTTIEVSTGNSLRRLFCVIPERGKCIVSVCGEEECERGRTSTLITTENATTKELAIRVDGGTDFLCIGTRTHGINVHLVFLRYTAEEFPRSRPEITKTRKNVNICASKQHKKGRKGLTVA